MLFQCTETHGDLNLFGQLLVDFTENFDLRSEMRQKAIFSFHTHQTTGSTENAQEFLRSEVVVFFLKSPLLSRHIIPRSFHKEGY